MAEQLNRNASSQDLSTQNSQNQQFRQESATEQSYNSEEQRQVYHSTQQSFNEQREQYREQAFNTYEQQSNFSENSGDFGTERENFSGEDSAGKTYDSALDKLSREQHASAASHTIPEQLNDGDKVLEHDAKLDKLLNQKDSVIGKEEKIYHSIKQKKRLRLVKAKKYEDVFIPQETKIHRLLNDKRSTKYVTSSKSAPGGRLLNQGTERRLSKKEYDKKAGKKHRRKYLKDELVRKAVKKGRLLFDNQDIAEDENIAEMKRSLKKGARSGRLLVRENMRNIRKKTNKYARLKNASEKEKLLDEKINQRINKLEYRQDKNAIKEEYGKRLKNSYGNANNAARAEKYKAERRKKMQRARQQRKEREGNFFRRTRHTAKLRKKSVEQKAKKVKNILSVVFSVGMIIVILLFGVLFLFIFLMALFQGTAETYLPTIVQVDYGVMSECTAYYRKMETDLEEKLLDTEVLEEEIQISYGDDIYEYVYNLADISFDSTTLVAYLGAKYVEFTLEDVQSDLEELFALNYNLIIETRMEERDIEDTSVTDPETGHHPVVREEVKICYITLEKIPLEELVVSRLNEEQLNQYNIYKMTSGGQQVYGPVMATDWTNLITSNFGERIHPITKERTYHNGVDIGIPTGTPLYSAVDGTVILAQYSDTAGNYLKVQNSTGWTVIFMHMDSISVSVGDTLKKGDFVGYSGNTGRSTGPHLHLEVRNENNTPINPIFIIPQNCVLYTETE